MKRVGKEPRLLPNVMEAIANLKEKHGSTQKQIIDHISHVFRKSKDNSRNVTMQIRRALDHGIHSGLIKHKSGKYILGLDKKDYAVFRRFRQIDDCIHKCARRRKRGKRRKRRSRRKRRRSFRVVSSEAEPTDRSDSERSTNRDCCTCGYRRHSSPNDKRRGHRTQNKRRSYRRRRAYKQSRSSDGEASDASESTASGHEDTPEPMDRRGRRKRSRRRKHRRSKRRRKPKHRRHSVDPNEDNTDASQCGRKESTSNVPVEKRRSEQDKIDYDKSGGSGHNQERNPPERSHPERNHDQDDDDMECGNPECLCNIKQEEDSPRCMSRENNYYNDSYLN